MHTMNAGDCTMINMFYEYLRHSSVHWIYNINIYIYIHIYLFIYFILRSLDFCTFPFSFWDPRQWNICSNISKPNLRSCRCHIKWSLISLDVQAASFCMICRYFVEGVWHVQAPCRFKKMFHLAHRILWKNSTCKVAGISGKSRSTAPSQWMPHWKPLPR